MKDRILATLAFTSLVGLAPFSLSAQNTAEGISRARVATPISVAEADNLSFGALALLPNQSGTVTVHPSREPTTFEGAIQATCGTSHYCMSHPARFDIRGEQGMTYRVTLPSRLTAIGRSTGQTLTIRSLVASSLSAPSRPMGGQLSDMGQDQLSVGGTLVVPIGTREDIFEATFAIIVSYD